MSSSPVTGPVELDGEEEEEAPIDVEETDIAPAKIAPAVLPVTVEQPVAASPVPSLETTSAAAPVPNGRSPRPAAAIAEAPDAELRYATPRPAERRLFITFRRSGNLERDKYRLKELYDTVRDPKGRDGFVIRLVGSGTPAELSFPNDACTISEKLTTELQKHFRVEFEVV